MTGLQVGPHGSLSIIHVAMFFHAIAHKEINCGWGGMLTAWSVLWDLPHLCFHRAPYCTEHKLVHVLVLRSL